MLDYLDRQELRISEPGTMMINDCLSPGITLASVRSSNSRSFCCLSNQARCTSNDVVTGTLRRLQGRKAGQCRLRGYSPTAWWLGKAKGGMAWNTKRRPVVRFPEAKEIVPSIITVFAVVRYIFSANELGMHRQRLIGDVGVKVN